MATYLYTSRREVKAGDLGLTSHILQSREQIVCTIVGYAKQDIHSQYIVPYETPIPTSHANRG